MHYSGYPGKYMEGIKEVVIMKVTVYSIKQPLSGIVSHAGLVLVRS